MTPRELGEWLACLAGSDGEDPLFAMMMVAHFDESASQNPKDVFVVAGYLARAKQWPKFSRDWTATLRRYAVQPPVFHMTDFEGGWERFTEDRLPKAKRVPLLKELIGLIHKYELVGVGMAFPALEYERLCDEYLPRAYSEPKYAHIVGEIREPSNYLLLMCLENLRRHCVEHRIKGKIRCVFDENPQSSAKIHSFYTRHVHKRATLRQRFRGISFDSRKEVVPLQAADVLAYEVMKHVKNQVIGLGAIPLRKSAEALQQNMKLYGKCYDPVHLRFIFQESARRARELDERQARNGGRNMSGR